MVWDTHGTLGVPPEPLVASDCSEEKLFLTTFLNLKFYFLNIFNCFKMRVISSISIKFFETSSNGQMCELQNMHLPFMNRKYTAAGKGVAKVFWQKS